MKNPDYIPLPDCPKTATKKHHLVTDSSRCLNRFGHQSATFSRHDCTYAQKCVYCSFIDDRSEEQKIETRVKKNMIVIKCEKCIRSHNHHSV